MLQFKIDSYLFELGEIDQKIQDILDARKEEEDLADVAMREDEQGKNPASWVADEGIWEKAKKAVLGSKKTYKNPWPVIVHVYKNMGGKKR